MPSSISNSEQSRSLKYIVVLLAVLAGGEAILQRGATWVLGKYGKNEIRWAEERKAAEALQHDGKGVLLIGSSVLLGVDQALLERRLPDWTVRRMVMVGTFCTDWEYSLRRLFREGVKPDYVILVPLPFQIYGDSFRGDYLPLHWIDRRDIPDLARRRNLDLTTTSNLLFASYNRFFALRDDIRNALLGNLIPGHKTLVSGAPNKRIYTESELEQIMGDRLAALKTLLAQNGSRLMVLRYPAPDMEASLDLLEHVAAAREIPFLSVLRSVPKADFEDQYHLNPRGTENFTQALGPVLGEQLKRMRGD